MAKPSPRERCRSTSERFNLFLRSPGGRREEQFGQRNHVLIKLIALAALNGLENCLGLAVALCQSEIIGSPDDKLVVRWGWALVQAALDGRCCGIVLFSSSCRQ